MTEWVGHLQLKWVGQYGKVSFVWKYAQKMLVFR